MCFKKQFSKANNNKTTLILCGLGIFIFMFSNLLHRTRRQAQALILSSRHAYLIALNIGNDVIVRFKGKPLPLIICSSHLYEIIPDIENDASIRFREKSFPSIIGITHCQLTIFGTMHDAHIRKHPRMADPKRNHLLQL